MPPLPAVPGVLRASLKFTMDASIDAGCRFFFSYTGGPPTQGDANTLSAALQQQFGEHLMSPLADNCVLVESTIQDLSSDTGVVSTNTTTQAGGAGAMLTASACYVINHLIGRHYRGGKPRTYIPGVVAGNLTGTNEVSSAAQTAIGTAWSGAINAFLGTSGVTITLQDIVNVSYYSGNKVVTSPTTGRARNVPQLRPGGPVVDHISGSVVAAKLGSQRRRLNT